MCVWVPSLAAAMYQPSLPSHALALITNALHHTPTPPSPGSCDPLRTYLSVPAPDASPEALLLALCLWPQMPEELAAQAPVPQGVAPPPARQAHAAADLPAGRFCFLAREFEAH